MSIHPRLAAALLLAAWSITTGPVAAVSDPVPTHLQWRGGPALERLQAVSAEGRIEVAGLEGSVRSRATAQNLRVDVDLSVIRATECMVGDGGWSLSPSGQVEDLSTESHANLAPTLDLYFARSLREGRYEVLDRERKGEEEYTPVRITYGPHDHWDYFVADDGSLSWIRVDADGEVSWIALGDWKMVDGVRLWGTERSTFDNPARNQSIEWTTVETSDALASDAFERPNAERRFTIAGGGDTVEVPIEVFLDVRVFFPVTVNGVEGTAILDTGAESTAFDRAYAERCGLDLQGKVVARGTGGETEASFASGVDIRMHGAQLHDVVVGALDLSDIARRLGHPFDVVLGKELLNESVVEIDYRAHRMVLHTSEYTYAGDGETLPLIRGAGGLLQLEVSVEGHEPGLFDFDLGNGNALAIFDAAAEQWGLRDGRPLTTAAGGGVGGVVVRDLVTVRSIRLGDFVLHDVPTILSGTEGGAFDTQRVQGNIGAQVFNRFRVFVDFPHQSVHLEPQAGLDAPFERNRAGLQLGFEDGAWVVRHVAPHSPAEEAGLEEGVRIESLDDVVPTEQNWAALAREAVSREDGTVLRVREVSGKTIELTLRTYF